jgi:hypothetical protein
MSIQLSPEQRSYLERLARGPIKPTRRQKALALLRLADGDTPERAAECAGIQKSDIETLASDFTERGLDGIGLGGSKPERLRAPSLQDDDIFEEYLKILKARRKRRARQEGSAE